MIFLEAIRISVRGSFEFRISPSQGIKSIVADAQAAVLTLQSLGVKNAQVLVTHSIDWGAVEIAEPD